MLTLRGGTAAFPIEMGRCAMAELFEEPESQGVLLVDVENAFNSLNRNVALHNIFYVCPAQLLPDTKSPNCARWR